MSKKKFIVSTAFMLASLIPTSIPAQPVDDVSRMGLLGTEQVIDLRTVAGPPQRILVATPARPRAAIVMLPGGAGDVGIARDGDLRHNNNFVIRTRTLWEQHGYAVIFPDTIDRVNLRGVRSSPGYAKLVNSLVAFSHANVPGPVFLLGTSQGTIAAVNGAANATPGSIAGVVLTESVSLMGSSGETVFSAEPQHVRVPALIVANRDDQCDVAPPQQARTIAASMRASPDVRVLLVAGGINRSRNNCGSLTPHGYFGIEDNVVGQISRWMDAHR